MSHSHFADTAPPLSVRIGQGLRWLIKRTLWEHLTTLFKLIGQPLQTVQVLVLDRARGVVLLLRTAESKTGWVPVQGLRDKNLLRFPPRYDDDPRQDALRELLEEALLVDDIDRAAFLPRLQLLHRYREGVFAQFDCRVYGVEVDSHALRLKPENSEGLPVWVAIAEAQTLVNSTLAGLLAAKRDNILCKNVIAGLNGDTIPLPNL